MLIVSAQKPLMKCQYVVLDQEPVHLHLVAGRVPTFIAVEVGLAVVPLDPVERDVELVIARLCPGAQLGTQLLVQRRSGRSGGSFGPHVFQCQVCAIGEPPWPMVIHCGFDHRVCSSRWA